MIKTPDHNTLFYGDNLTILREHIADESVDLIYLDPPFNSNASYNVLFKAPGGEQSQSQIEAFDDTWEWGEVAERAFDEVMISGNTDAAEMLRAMRGFLKENAMMAYLAMMAVRLIELHRVLKPTGSLYLHCDPTASHYLKILLDAVFGKEKFQNEIIWSYRRWPTKSKRFQRMHDDILFYHKDPDRSCFNTLTQEPTESSKKRWKGLKQSVTFDNEGNRLPTLETGDQSVGVALNAVWDIPVIAPVAKERLGYPTQKPLALLERIIAASSNPGDVVLDPFCGCGTTVHAAQKMERRWIGIDVTHLAIGLVKRRLIDAFPKAQFDILGVPKDAGAAEALAEADKHQFQLWALSVVEAQPYKGGRKGADGGVDGYIYFKPDGKTTEKAVVSIKGGKNVGVTMIRDLIATIERDKAKVGIMLSLAEPTREMKKEAAAAGLYKTGMHGDFPRIQILTIADLFDGDRPRLPWVDASVFRKAKRENIRGENKTDQGDLEL